MQFDQIWITTPLNQEQTLALFIDCLGIDVPIEQKDDHFSAIFPDEIGFQIHYINAWPIFKYWPAELGVTSTVHLDIGLDKTASGWIPLERLVAAAVEMMKRVNWDVVLVRGDSEVILLRKENRLSLNQNSSFWTEARSKNVDLPFSIEPIIHL